MMALRPHLLLFNIIIPRPDKSSDPFLVFQAEEYPACAEEFFPCKNWGGVHLHRGPVSLDGAGVGPHGIGSNYCPVGVQAFSTIETDPMAAQFVTFSSSRRQPLA